MQRTAPAKGGLHAHVMRAVALRNGDRFKLVAHQHARLVETFEQKGGHMVCDGLFDHADCIYVGLRRGKRWRWQSSTSCAPAIIDQH